MPVCLTQHMLEAVQLSTGLPWWAAIVLSTLALRATLTLPLARYQALITGRLERLKPEMDQWREAWQSRIRAEGRRANMSQTEATEWLQRELKKTYKELLERDRCQPWRTQVPLFAQLPLWITMSLALRNLTAEQMMETSPATFEALAEGGVLWFADLTVADGTLVLPWLLGLANLANIELNVLRHAAQATDRQRLVTNFFRFLALLMIPVASNVPAGLCLYWTTSSLYGLGQNIALRLPRVRALLAIPAAPSDSRTPLRDLARIARERHRAFWAEVRRVNNIGGGGGKQ